MQKVSSIRLRLALPAVMMALGACNGEPARELTAEPAVPVGADVLQAPELRPCGADGYVRGRLYGALQRDLAWSGDSLKCEGMPRPDDAGARLRFADDGVAIIVALPGLTRATTANELTANVTLIDEENGRFFSTSGAGVCWSDITAQALVAGDEYAVGGRLYCISPLAEVNGLASVSIEELEFAGYVDWSAK